MKKQEIEGCISLHLFDDGLTSGKSLKSIPDQYSKKVFKGNFLSEGILDDNVLRVVQYIEGKKGFTIDFHFKNDVIYVETLISGETKFLEIAFDGKENARIFFKKITGFDYKIAMIKKHVLIPRKP